MLHSPSLVQFYSICLVFVKYIAKDYLRKQFFGRNFGQSPSHLNFSIFSVTSEQFYNHDVNINGIISVKSSKFNGFS